MIIVIAIRDIWRRYDEESRALTNMGLTVPEVVRLAFGYATLSVRPDAVVATHTGQSNIFATVRNLLVDRMPYRDRLPFSRQSGYGLDDQAVYKVVDIIGEISLMLADAVIAQLGSFPPQLRMSRCIGQDLTLIYNEEHSPYVHRRLDEGRTCRPQR